MKGIVARVLGLIFAVGAVSVALTAETPKPKTDRIPLITDWSHQHVVFSKPRTPEQAARIQNDFRYLQQQQRMTVQPVLSKKVNRAALRRLRRRLGRRMHRDWTQSLGDTSSVGADRFPAKYSFDSTQALCVASGTPDFVVFPANVASGVGTGTITALMNLYPGCPTGPIPAYYWSYDTGGTVNTSPVLSLDGSQIAFTQTNGGNASLVLLRWTAGGIANNPAAISTVSNGSYPGCGAPCMTTFALGADDTNSSVYYDYTDDIAYVGDDAGTLHRYTGVFKGTPIESIGGGWPVVINNNRLTSPVFDSTSRNTFVGDNAGFLYWVDGAGNATQSAQLDVTNGLAEGPVVDSSIGAVYAFSSDDGTGSAGVFQLSTSFGNGTSGSEAQIGAASVSTTPVYRGAFDHNYVASVNSTGNMYVCGNPGLAPTIYAIPIAAGVMGTPVAGPALSGTTTTTCSPLTDVYNPTITGNGIPEEWIFASVQANGTPTACLSTSCIMNFRATPWAPLTGYNAGQLILDSNLNIQVADNSGQTSGATPPTWGTTPYAPTVDGTVHWRCQGPLVSNPANGPWTANNLYAGAFEIIDANNNIQISQIGGGTSGATQPVWGTNYGDVTSDNTVSWINLGANPVAGLQSAGGTSGIIMDNTALIGSQVYYGTLAGGCAPFGNGGCAVQASQQGLN